MWRLVAAVALVLTVFGATTIATAAVPEPRVALVIGNSAYRMGPLKHPANDARLMAETLRGLGFDATRDQLLDQLEAYRLVLKRDDRLLIYYAGHGQIDVATGAGYWQPVDAKEGKRRTWISNDAIRNELKALPAKHVLVIADSCFSGTLTQTRGDQLSNNIPKDRYFSEIDSYVSRKVISSGGVEPVADSGSGGHSVFAYYLLKSLRNNSEPYLTSYDLFSQLDRAVTNNSDQKPVRGTVDKAGDEGPGDFTFILK